MYDELVSKDEGLYKKVGDLISFSQGVQVPVEEQLTVYEPGYTNFIRIVDVVQANNDVRYIQETERGKIDYQDVFMVRYGSQTAGLVARGYKGIIANNLFTVKSALLSNAYLYCYFGSENVQAYLRGNSTSSTMPALNFATLKSMDIFIPEQQKLEAFTEKVDLLFDLQLQKRHENTNLIRLRDALLPRLMSGELDVSNIDI